MPGARRLHAYILFNAHSSSMANWSEEETLKLIEIWGESTIQAMLEGARRNKDVFIKIAREMEAAGYTKSGDQCSNKIKKLRFEYRKVKDKNGKTGEGRSNWRYYDAMNAILGDKPATCPPVVVESGCSSHPVQSQVDESLEEQLDDEQSECVSLVSETGSRSETPASVSASDTETTPQQKKTRKRKTKASDRFDVVESLVEKMVKMQEESEKSYIHLEEKMLEMEERRQKDSQEFMMRMMALMFQPPAIPPGSISQPQFPDYNRYEYPTYNDSSAYINSENNE